MNFFQHQDQARKKTGLLVGLLALAVACLIALTIALVGAVLYFAQANGTSISAYESAQLSWFEHAVSFIRSPLSLWIALGVAGVVLLGSLYKLVQLSRGGRAVAESLGGRLLDPSSSEKAERRLLNIVEEMAIASGNPVPQVYLLDDDSINAFAAGLSRRDAVVGVTRGCMNLLSRDELQGVIAHEFSHIHNGDMRLNMRLVAILHGILVIGLIGQMIARGSSTRSYGSYRRRVDARQAGFGLALMAIGYSGTFFGNLIKAAVSRQREFLADASAVQFTRNPQGISGALKKIGGFSLGSELSGGNAAQFSHLFFGQGVATAFRSMMATHPPLADRIQRIEPRWQGGFPSVSVEDIAVESVSSADEGVANFSASAEVPAANLSESIVQSAGEPSVETLQQVSAIQASLPKEIIDATRQCFAARALLYATLLDDDKTLRDKQLFHLKQKAHPATYKELEALYSSLQYVSRENYHVLVQLSMPALKEQSDKQYAVFKKNLQALIRSDKKVSLYEWCLFKSVTSTVEERQPKGSHSLKQVEADVLCLLFVLAKAGKNAEQLGAVNAGLAAAGISPVHEAPSLAASLSALDKVCSRLEKVRPLEKPKVLKALVACITYDKQITPDEKSLFCAVADVLNCPVPPLG